MRPSLCKQKLGGLILAALTAGALSVPAAASQDASTATKTQATHTHPATSHTSAAHKSTAHATTLHSTATHTTTAHTKSAATTTSRRSSKKRVKKVKGQAAPTPDRITEIQQALAKKGMLEGSPSGQWDDSTTDAMKKFQSSNGLNPTGKLDALTLQKLGLGSETAGLAAPTPPPNATNHLKYLSSLPPDSNSSNQ